MLKQVEVTPAIRARLIASMGGNEETDVGNLAVFEAQALNTKPLVRRKTGLFQNAVVGRDTLQAMQSQVNGGETVPLKTMHNSELPTGRVFHAGIVGTGDGHSALHTMFYIPKDSQQNIKYVSDLNANVIQDVSVGFQGKQLLCSECGFDYASPDATFENIWGCECDAGHKIGQDNVHLRIHGLDGFNDLSLVDRGASTGAEIMPRSKQALARSPDMMSRLSAGGIGSIIECRFRMSDSLLHKDQSVMTEKEAVELQARAIVAERDIAELKAAATAHAAKVTELTSQLATAQAEATALKAGDAATLTNELTAVKADLTAAVGVLDARLVAALALTGKTGAELPKTVAEKIALDAELQAAIRSTIPAGGAGRGPATGSGDGVVPSNFSAFKRK